LVNDPSTQIPSLLQQFEYKMARFKEMTRPFEKVSGAATCELCKLSLLPLDSFLDNKTIIKLMEKVALEICIKLNIEGGQKSLCEGAIDEMAQSLIPSLV